MPATKLAPLFTEKPEPRAIRVPAVKVAEPPVSTEKAGPAWIPAQVVKLSMPVTAWFSRERSASEQPMSPRISRMLPTPSVV